MVFKLPDKQTLLFYAKELCGKRFSPGIDNVSAADNLSFLLLNADVIVKELNDKKYLPKPALSFSALKRNGKERELCKFCALDTVIQRALASTLAEQLEEIFSKYSFAYRPGGGIQAAAAQFCAFAGKYKYAAKIDPVACFDNIDRRILFEKLDGIVENDAFLYVVKEYAATRITDEKGICYREKGILQGSPLSPALCNLYLTEADLFLEKKGIPFCRYADDIVLFAKDEASAVTVSNELIKILSERLKLSLNTEKFRIAEVSDLVYLGYRFERNENGNLVVCEPEQDKSNRFSAEWLGSEKLKMSKSVNLLSDGILTKKDAAVAFETDKDSSVIPLGAVEQINVYSSVTVAPYVLKTLFEQNVSVNYFDRYGYLLGSFQPNTAFKSVATPLMQLKIYQRERGARADYARDFLLSQIHHIRLNLSYYLKQYKSETCAKAIAFIDSERDKVKRMKTVEDMLTAEALVKGRYFSCFNEIIRNNDFSFAKRTRRPPKDEVNALLSFANTFLYNYIAVEINKTSLDIRIAFLHSTTSRRQSLNLDVADVFKPLIADRTVLTLINKRIIRKEHFTKEANGSVFLNNAGKRILINALYEKLDSAVTVKDKSLSYAEVIREEIKSLCSDVRRQKKHKSFRQAR